MMRKFGIAFAVAIFFGAVVLATVSDRDGSSSTGVDIQIDAPSFEAPIIYPSDGIYRLVDNRGEYTVIVFFASWCEPCRKEFKEIVQLSRNRPDVNIVSVVYDNADKESAKNFLSSNGGTWPLVSDDSGKLKLSYAVVGLPEVFVVNGEGKITAHASGIVNLNWLNSQTGQG